MTWLSHSWRNLLELLLVHLSIAVPAIIIATLIAIPIGRFAYRFPRVGGPVLSASTLLYEQYAPFPLLRSVTYCSQYVSDGDQGRSSTAGALRLICDIIVERIPALTPSRRSASTESRVRPRRSTPRRGSMEGLRAERELEVPSTSFGPIWTMQGSEDPWGVDGAFGLGVTDE